MGFLSDRYRPGLLILIFLILTPWTYAGAAENQAADTRDLDALAQRLIAEGFAPEKIAPLFAQKTVFFDPDGVSLFFIHTESSLNYDQFTTKESIAKAAGYIKTHKETLDKAEADYGVDKTAIAAILLVETQLGSYLGNRTVINTLSTMAALTDPVLVEKIWNSIPDKKKPSREKFLEKVEKRSAWGYEELKALLQYTEREKLAPESIKGSYAGAMGIPQFMPSNALTLARDGNADGKIDLFNHEDAIVSVANYLKSHGWKPDISRQRRHEVLFEYNHSNYYVDTLMKISDKLKEG